MGADKHKVKEKDKKKDGCSAVCEVVPREFKTYNKAEYSRQWRLK